MTMTTEPPHAPDAERHPARAPLEDQIAQVGPCDVAIAVLTYNNADTIGAVIAAAGRGSVEHFAGARMALVNADAGSSDGTPDIVAASGLPAVLTAHQVAFGERVDVPFHGVPGRGPALHTALSIGHRLGARVVIVLEADLVAPPADWIARLARPVLSDKADFVSPAYARHRYDGTITNLLIAPLVRALYGRRLRQPLGGQQALSARLVEHLLLHPKWDWQGRELADLWIVGTAIADGFSVWESWLGRRVIRSRTRTTELPAMVAQTLGGVFTVMDRHQDLWTEVRGSEPLPAVGEATLPAVDPREVDVEQMVNAFRLGLRDLTPIWEHILAPETLGDVLSLEPVDAGALTFPDDLWARVVYDFALGHHYAVIHRDHLLRSLVPLYLGRTAAYVLATRGRSAAASEAVADNVAVAFERQKPYLVERWT